MINESKLRPSENILTYLNLFIHTPHHIQVYIHSFSFEQAVSIAESFKVSMSL